MTYISVTKAMANTGPEAQAHEFSKRRKVVVVPSEFLELELGLRFNDLTPDLVERIHSELLIRQRMKSTDIIKWAEYNYALYAVTFYVINPGLPEVLNAVEAPTETIYL